MQRMMLCVITAALAAAAPYASAQDKPCPGPYKAETWTNCSGETTLKDGAKYTGTFKDGKRDGKGVTVQTNGRKYEGDYKNDKRHGKGTRTFPAGNKFVGDYVDDKRTGQGTEYRANGSVLRTGRWQEGEYQGK